MERTVPRLVREVIRANPDVPAQYFKNEKGDFESVTFKEMWDNAMSFGAGLLALGSVRGEKIGFIADDRKEWQQADLGLLSIGAADVPRGCDASPNDLKYILSFTECRTVITENSSVAKKILGIREEVPTLKSFIIFDQPTDEVKKLCAENKIDLYHFDDIIQKGQAFREANPTRMDEEINKGEWDDIAAIIFTSGTTGVPKGVMLSHGNFITQLDEIFERIYLNVGEKALCVLPVWHVYMRLVEYVIIGQGAALCYSKPIGSILLPDFQKINPHLMPAVPRVFEAIKDGVDKKMRRAGGVKFALYTFFLGAAILHDRMDRKLFRKSIRFRKDFLPFWWIILVLPWLLLKPLKALGDVLVFKKIRELTGKNFRAGIAGGGAYPKAMDEYFWAVGINVVEGYGLTETAPIVAVRWVDKPVFGSIGTAIRGVNVRIVDMEGKDIGRCRKGVLQVKGETVMKGYYKRPELTAKVLSPDGWLDTGDLAILGVDSEIKILGRVKDTIVLRGGENIEPLPLENKLKESQYIDSVVVVGQDQRSLGALILLNQEEIEIYAKNNSISYKDYNDLLTKPEIYKFVDSIVRDTISQKNGFRMFERIQKFVFLTKPFEVGRELSAKQDLMRYKITELYAKEIKQIFKE